MLDNASKTVAVCSDDDFFALLNLLVTEMKEIKHIEGYTET